MVLKRDHRPLNLVLASKLRLITLGAKTFCLTTLGLRTAHRWATEFGYRSDRGIWEGYCPHGIGHPIGVMDRECDGIHGCDGCCSGKGPFTNDGQ